MATNWTLYGWPAVPSGIEVVVMLSGTAGVIVMLNCLTEACAGDSESVTCT